MGVIKSDWPIFILLLLLIPLSSTNDLSNATSVTYSCGNFTTERISYFVQPDEIPLQCSFSVIVNDSSVTQIRLDFEQFSLDQPQRYGASNEGNIYPYAFTCHNDKFTVSSPSIGTSGNLGFENLCGENAGQHIYIPVNATSGSATAELAFNLANRTQYTGLLQPRWKIRITQIDCCASDTKDLCAPLGCLQYYTDRTGTFESFNFNGGAGHYQGGLNYAICFKRYDGICSILYAPIKFQLAANDLTTPYGSYGCNVATTNPDDPYSQDYLFIPHGHAEMGVNASLFCGDYLQGNPVRTYAPGPMFVYFRTDRIAFQVILGEEIGFRIRYEELMTGCHCF